MPTSYKVNEEIEAEKVHLIDESGHSLGIVSIDQALLLAHSRGYDLVQVSYTDPPVCRLLDFGKYLYEQEKKQRKARQKRSDLKEIRLSLSIEPHDLLVKENKIREFLKEGHKVKLTLLLHGRERDFLSRAYQFLEDVAAKFNQEAKVEKSIERIGNRLYLILQRK